MVGGHENWGKFKCRKWGELLRHSQRPPACAGLQLARRSSEIGSEAANAKPGEIGLQTVDEACALSDQGLTLAAGSSRILVLERRDGRHAAMLRFAAQPAEEGALEEFRVETIRLRRRCSRDTGTLDGWIT